MRREIFKAATDNDAPEVHTTQRKDLNSASDLRVFRTPPRSRRPSTRIRSAIRTVENLCDARIVIAPLVSAELRAAAE